MKIRFIAALGLLMALPTALSGQNSLTYFLPSTRIGVDVEAVVETFHPGPYAGYAKKFLGIEAKQEASVRTYVSSVSVEPTLEADPSARYQAASSEAVGQALTLSTQGLVSLGTGGGMESLRWTFPAQDAADFSRLGVSSPYRTEKKVTYKNVQTDTSVTRVATTRDVTVALTPEQRAREAADMVLRARQERFNITIGNTDATYSGEALGSAIAELSRLEEEYMTLFVGYTTRQVQNASFSVIPVEGKEDAAYPVFRLSPEGGLTSPESGSGTLYFLSFKAAPIAAPAADGARKSSKGGQVLYYRIPAVCETALTNGRETLLKTRIPVYQFGETSSYPINVK
jgi:hypothetical protein